MFFLAAALSRLVTLTCPHCGHKKRVERRDRPVAFRVCPKCHRRFDDPVKKGHRR
jgi:transcription elongation factor Elf1